jgi:hypothetical protein
MREVRYMRRYSAARSSPNKQSVNMDFNSSLPRHLSVGAVEEIRERGCRFHPEIIKTKGITAESLQAPSHIPTPASSSYLLSDTSPTTILTYMKLIFIFKGGNG